MISIIYVSRAKIEFSQIDLEDLALLSQLNNAQIGVTGYLSYQKGRFIQYIEGEETQTRSLMDAIEADARHEVLYQMSSVDIKTRLFESWSMRLITQEELDRFSLEKCIDYNLISIKNKCRSAELRKEFLWSHINLIAKIRNTTAI